MAMPPPSVGLHGKPHTSSIGHRGRYPTPDAKTSPISSSPNRHQNNTLGAKMPHFNGTIHPTNHHEPLPLGVCGWGGYIILFTVQIIVIPTAACITTHLHTVPPSWVVPCRSKASHRYAYLVPPPSWRALSHGKQVQNRLRWIA